MVISGIDEKMEKSSNRRKHFYANSSSNAFASFGEARSRRRLGTVMREEHKIYVDAARPSTLNDGAGVLTDFATFGRGGSGVAQLGARTEDTSDG